MLLYVSFYINVSYLGRPAKEHIAVNEVCNSLIYNE